MFGLFGRRTTDIDLAPRMIRLLELYEELGDQMEAIYANTETFSPPELHFFAMSAVSVYAQSFGQLQQRDMEVLVTSFTEQALALIQFRIPNASYQLLHNAFVDRFGQYSDLIVDLANAQSTGELQQSALSLVAVLDRNAKVQRDMVTTIVPSTKLVAHLIQCQGDVKNAMC